DRVVQGLTYFEVIQRLLQGVELHEIDPIDIGDLGSNAARSADRLHLIHRYIDNRIDLAGLQLQHAAVVLTDHQELSLLRMRLARLPVMRVRFEHDPAAMLPALEREGSGADGLVEEALPFLLQELRRQDRGTEHCEIVEERRERLVETELDGARIDRFHPGDRLEEALPV